MKVLATILLVILSLSSISCSKNSNDKNSSKNSFFVKIDGVDYSPGFINGFIVGAGGTISVSGSESNGNNVVINIPINSKEGDVFTVAGLQFVASYDAADGDVVIADEGSVTITSYDVEAKRISGVFNFTGKSIKDNTLSVLFTQGEFSSTYREL